MKIKAILLSLVMIGGVYTIQAQTATPNVSKRQVKQQQRIGKGVRSGELTKGETVALQKQQKRINKSKKAAKADGKVSRRERAAIHKRQNAANRNIARKKNNRVSRN